MRKVLTVSLILVAIFCLAGCTGATDGPGDGDDPVDPGTGISGTIAIANWTANTYVSGPVRISESLTISRGVTVTLASNAWITIESGAYMRAIGDDEAPITFTGATESTYWRQIDFAGSTSPENILSYCTIRHAGTRASDGCYAVDLNNNSVATFDHCTVADNLAGGLDASVAGSGTRVDNCSFYHNGAYGLRINDNVALPNTNAYIMDGYATDQFNSVNFVGYVARTPSSARTFDQAQVPYYFDQSFHVIGTMNVAPGVALTFGPNVYMQVESTGVLAAVGTATAPILFTSRTAAPWRQIDFNGTASTSNRLENCVIERGGTNSSGCYVVDAHSNAVIDIENCVIRNNMHGGVDLTNAGVGTKLIGNTFSDNGTAASGPYDYDVNAGVSRSGNVAENYKL